MQKKSFLSDCGEVRLSFTEGMRSINFHHMPDFFCLSLSVLQLEVNAGEEILCSAVNNNKLYSLPSD